MIYNTKAEFMAALQNEAERCLLPFEEMSEDFEQHFQKEQKTAKPKARYAKSSVNRQK